MVNEERTKLMTKAEIFRVREKRKALRLNRFRRSDYISYEMIRSAIAFIFAYGLFFLMWILYFAEPLMTQRSIEELAALAGQAGIALVCLLVCFLVAAYYIFKRKYVKARDQVKDYQAILKQLERLYEKENEKVWRNSEGHEE